MIKNVLNNKPSRVAIVTTKSNDDNHGITISTFSSLSNDPQLIMIIVNVSAKSHKIISDTKRFVVNFLCESSKKIADYFANRDHSWEPKWGVTDSGLPYLIEATGCLECSVIAAHTHNGHTIFVAKVTDASSIRDAKPLLWWKKDYHTIEIM